MPYAPRFPLSLTLILILTVALSADRARAQEPTPLGPAPAGAKPAEPTPADPAAPGAASLEQRDLGPDASAERLQPAPRPLHALRYHYANDTFTSTDYYFTQGMGLTWTSPLLSDSPLVIPLPDLGGPRQVSLSWRYEGFTPEDYELRPIQRGDRPFAAFMSLAHRHESISAAGESSLWAEWALGYLGPAVGGQQFQAEIHRNIAGKQPRGWRNQLDDDLVAQLELGATHALFRYEELLELRLEAALRGGTLYANGEAGARLQFGLLGPALGPPDSLRLYLWVRGLARGVGFNALLQGGVFGDSVYTLGARDVRHFVAVGQWGAAFEYGSCGLSFSFSFISREFRGGRSHAWGELGLTLFFG